MVAPPPAPAKPVAAPAAAPPSALLKPPREGAPALSFQTPTRHPPLRSIVVPCALCGYDSPEELCPHCRGAVSDREFARGAPPASGRGAVAAGFAALPRGLSLLATTRGTKRWLVPPFVLTSVAFAALFTWAWNGFERLVEYARETGERIQGPEVSWYLRALDFVLESWAFVLLAKLSGALLFLVIGFFAALYAFSLFYEAISGPFLDEVQGRIEQRWFGVDPRNATQRPTDWSVARCAAHTAAVSAVALALGFLALRLTSGAGLLWSVPTIALALVLPFAVWGRIARSWGRWFLWAVGVEIVTLWTSVRTSLFALLLLVFCLPLKFVPLVGPLLFGAAAGFATAISLLDIPFSRRRWNLGQRFSFLGHHAPALAAFGSVASLLFLIPFAGPILMVPAASIGGLWLFVRLDKSRLRVNSQRIAERRERQLAGKPAP